MTSQDPRAVWSQTTGRILLHPDNILGSGGEGAVYRLPSHPDLVAKVYHPDKLTSETIGKLKVMIDYPPRTENEQTGHIFVSWPKDTLHDVYSGTVIGFLMPMVDKTNDLYEYYNPSSRRRNAPHVNYANLCSVAKSLATALDRLHGITYAYIIGDINESNAYITEDKQVTLIDADSFQVTDSRTDPSTIYRCFVGKPEYTAPELQSISFADEDRNIDHDNFALAVVIYQLLMEGTHPFRGIYTDPGEKPQVETCIAQGYFLHSARVGRRVPLMPPRTALPWESLPANLRALFRRCFDDGHSDPAKRPNPRDWENALNEAMKDLRQCHVNPNHWYFGNKLGARGMNCTWCARPIEAFPTQRKTASFAPTSAQVTPAQNVRPQRTSMPQQAVTPAQNVRPQRAMKPPQPTRSPSQVHQASPQIYHRVQWTKASTWFLLLGIAIVGILIVAGIVLYGPVILATLVTWLLVLFRVVAYVLLAVMILANLVLVFRREPEFGIAVGIAICVLAVILLTIDGPKTFLVRYVSEEYAGFMFVGGLVAAVIGGIRKNAG